MKSWSVWEFFWAFVVDTPQALLETMLYLEDYLECIEHLPHDLRDRFTEMRELDLTGRILRIVAAHAARLFPLRKSPKFRTRNTFFPHPFSKPGPISPLTPSVQNSLDRLDSEQQTFFSECKENKQKEWRESQFEKLRGEYNKILEEADDKVRARKRRYWVSQKKSFKGHLRIMWTAWSKKNFCNGIFGQRTTSVQIFKIFGCHRNHGY